MSAICKQKLLTMLADSNKRQQLKEFELLKIFISAQAKQQMQFIDESRFYKALSKATYDCEIGSYFTLDLEEFWFSIVEADAKEHQGQGSYYVNIYAYFEALELQKLNERGEQLAQKVFEDGDIKID